MATIRSFADPLCGAVWLIDGPLMELDDEPVWASIERTLLAQPNAPCVTCGTQALTRGALLAAVRNFKLPGQPRRVGIHVARSVASLVATLSTWRLGASYVPLPLEHPPARTAALLEACAVDLIISDTEKPFDGYTLLGDYLVADQRLFVLAGSRRVAEIEPQVCYIAHTSGTTGGPKSVRIPHRALLNRIGTMTQVLGAAASDVFLYKTSTIFDVHVWEFTLPLMVGGVLVIFPQAPYFDLFAVARLMTSTQVSFVGFVPGLLTRLLDVETFIEQNSIHTVLCGGEAWGPRLAQKFHAALPGRRLYNSYGPAETTISVANYEVRADAAFIALGHPVPNTTLLVEQWQTEDEREADVIRGMLSIGGAQVGLGYVDNRSPEAFFVRAFDGKPMRFYRTGDLVRLNTQTGMVSFVGREDTQVKINGVRIELQEIETTITGIDEVENCIVVVNTNGPAPLLCAAFKTMGNVTLDFDVIRRACRSALPAALMPSRLRQVTEFPLAASGKVDRALLLQQFLKLA